MALYIITRIFRQIPSHPDQSNKNNVRGRYSSERRRHQGGRILFEYHEGSIDIRVSFYITIYGELNLYEIEFSELEIYLEDTAIPAG
jgi:hypothetical protein